ncbi:MAG TPA: hypothetical protein VFW94_12495 [Candidatus Acidoferrales bacterium]|nr:hypothetical protein [Candidatus Acidoferrales bacterium]
MNTATIQQGRSGGATTSIAREDTAATASIASISDQDWYISRTHGIYHIPACAKGTPYALLLITSRSDALDLGDNRRFPFTISARQIAEDLLQDLQDHGVFLCEGPRPTAEELATATARRDAFYHRLISEGDMMWARGHSFREISDMHRRAALAMGTEREWAYVAVEMQDCPVCGEKIKRGVAVCKHCRAILDEERAAKHGVHRDHPEYRNAMVRSDSATANGVTRPVSQGVPSSFSHSSSNSRR